MSAGKSSKILYDRQVMNAMTIAFTLTCLVGCADSGPTNVVGSQTTLAENSADSDRAAFDAAQEQMEQVLPLLQQEAASTGVELMFESLAESSCLGSIVENRQEQTRWEGFLRVVVADPEQAQNALDVVTASLDAQGWTLDEDAPAPEGDPDFGSVKVYEKDNILIDASYGFGEPDTLEVFARTACVDHPTDHQMVRSALDPTYGSSSEYYADGQ